jgi:hypothetical protein
MTIKMQSTRHDVAKLAARVFSGADTSEAVALAWPLVCGSKVAQRAKASGFYDGTLYVLVPDPGWRSQLEAFSVHYTQKLSELTGAEVHRIQYEVKI